jgi:hypothetical protein
MVSVADFVLVGAALVVAGWGLERYRTRFVKTDLLIAAIISGGLVAYAATPVAFDALGDLLNIRRRVIVVALLGYLTLSGIVIYLATVVRETRRGLTELMRQLSVEQAAETDGGSETVHVIIPAYNEAATIRKVVESLPEAVCGLQVVPVVVSDGSGDETARRAEASTDRAVVVEHHVNQGQGGALQTGFRIAERDGATVVVTMDGDGQHPTEHLTSLVQPIVANKADFVVGSRYIGEDRSGNGVVRRSGIRVFTWLINLLTKSSVTDCTNGYRAIRGSILSELTLTEERFSAPELIIEARKNDLRVREVPVTIEQRDEGETKKPQLGYAVGLARTILVTWLR